jgi:hypothetical protein
LEAYVAGVVSDDNMGISVEIVREHLGFRDGFGRGRCLFHCDFLEFCKYASVTCTSTIHGRAVD